MAWVLGPHPSPSTARGWLLAALFAVITAALAVAPLMLWRSERADAIHASLDTRLVAQMEQVLFGEIVNDRQTDYLTWFVNVNDGVTEPFADTELEPPLYSWVRDSGGQPNFREYALDNGQRYRAFVRPTSDSNGYVTLASTSERDDDLSALRTRTALMALVIVMGSEALGVVASGLAISPMRRLMGDQQSFLADAAHEMRTPLAVIMASSSQALSRPRSSEEYVRSLSEIRSAAERAATGVNEMLDLVRFESGQTLPRVAPLRLDLLAEEVAAAVRADDATIVAEPSDALIVAADMALLRQAIENLVRNAARRAGRVELLTRVDRHDGVIDVVDDGPGFDPAVLPRVFERYQRGDRRGEAGIGLAIVRAIAVAHGGSVSAINNASGIGATVSIRIPLSR
ncbi:MAG: integral rane sensor signal transduction histidine kinase [Ilumatobacteraceae bacterium]|nr:integral rane sensor signal transduction histidine kinase [Ilumatobacteraceae bacterium]